LSFLLLAMNLRPAITAVGPLVGSIQETTGLSAAAVGLLSSLPLLAFSVFAPLARFGRQIGIERTLAIAMLMLTVGILVRSGASTAALFGGTVVLAAGIAVGNVLAPSLIKRDYAERVGSLTTVYALILAVWVVPAAIAAVLWTRAFFQPHEPSPPPEDSATVSVWRSPLAWCVTGFMGLQSLCFYVSVAWLPKVFQDGGYDPAVAGWLITGFQVVSIFAGIALPRLLALRKDQSALAVAASLGIAIGVVGLIVYPNWTVVWVALAGFGSGLSFPLALAFIGLRSIDHHQAASLSLMSQSMGYLLAAFGPLLFGLAHDLSGGWALPLAGFATCAVVQAIVGYTAGQNRTVSS
jgi:CP family cyanate transporter-like MFS transporter